MSMCIIIPHTFHFAYAYKVVTIRGLREVGQKAGRRGFGITIVGFAFLWPQGWASAR